MNFCEVLKELRSAKGVTQKDIAKACDLTPTCICQLESGARNPTGSTVAALAIYFGVSADYLLGLEDDFGVRTAETPSDTYSSEEREIIKKYRQLNANGQKLVKTVIDTHLATMAEVKQNKKYS